MLVNLRYARARYLATPVWSSNPAPPLPSSSPSPLPPPIFHSHSIKRNFSSATIIIQSPSLPRRLPACCLRPRLRPPPRAQDAICLSVKQRTDGRGRGRHRRSLGRSAGGFGSVVVVIVNLSAASELYTNEMPLLLSLSPPLLRWKSSSDFWLSFRYFSKAVVAAAAIDLAYIKRKRQLNFSFTSDRPGEIRPRARERRR